MGNILYITDYISTNKLISNNISYFIEGMSECCREHNICILGGETLLPNTYLNNIYEIVGNMTGIIDKKNIINGKKNIKQGNLIYGIRSSGIHTNGYSIVNKLFEKIKNEKINIINDIKLNFLNLSQMLFKRIKLSK